MKDIRLTAKALELAMEVVSDIQSQESPSFAYMVTRVQDALLQGMTEREAEACVDPGPQKQQENKAPFSLFVGSLYGGICLFISPYPNILSAGYPLVAPVNTPALYQFIDDMKGSEKVKLWKIELDSERATFLSVDEGTRFVADLSNGRVRFPIFYLKAYLDNLK